MRKKYFIELAKVVATIGDMGERRRVARLIAEVCVNLSPSFNYSVFYEACGVKL